MFIIPNFVPQLPERKVKNKLLFQIKWRFFWRNLNFCEHLLIFILFFSCFSFGLVGKTNLSIRAMKKCTTPREKTTLILKIVFTTWTQNPPYWRTTQWYHQLVPDHTACSTGPRCPWTVRPVCWIQV